jgi:hypothetical protein
MHNRCSMSLPRLLACAVQVCTALSASTAWAVLVPVSPQYTPNVQCYEQLSMVARGCELAR